MMQYETYQDFRDHIALFLQRNEQDINSIKEFNTLVKNSWQDRSVINASRVDHKLRKFLFNVIKTIEIKDLKKYFKICILASKLGICSKHMAIRIIEDSFEMRCINHCGNLFSFLENNLDELKELDVDNKLNNRILRLCNGLNGRLCAFQTDFRFRIDMFLSNFLPINDKSGVNLSSKCNTENRTELIREGSIDSDRKIYPRQIKNNRLSREKYRGISLLQKFVSRPALCTKQCYFKIFRQRMDEMLIILSDTMIRGLSNDSSQDEDSLKDLSIEEKLYNLKFHDIDVFQFLCMQFVMLFRSIQGFDEFWKNIEPETAEWVHRCQGTLQELLKKSKPSGVNTFLKSDENHVKVTDTYESGGETDDSLFYMEEFLVLKSNNNTINLQGESTFAEEDTSMDILTNECNTNSSCKDKQDNLSTQNADHLCDNEENNTKKIRKQEFSIKMSIVSVESITMKRMGYDENDFIVNVKYKRGNMQ